MDPEALYMQLGQLVASMPDLSAGHGPLPTDTLKWLARAHLFVSEVGDLGDAIA